MHSLLHLMKHESRGRRVGGSNGSFVLSQDRLPYVMMHGDVDAAMTTPVAIAHSHTLCL